MNPSQKIHELQSQIEQQKNSIRNCRHEYNSPVYDPEPHHVSKINYTAGYEKHGVDMYPIMYSDTEYKHRWSRECIKCGHKDYTYESEPVNTQTKPKFK